MVVIEKWLLGVRSQEMGVAVVLPLEYDWGGGGEIVFFNLFRALAHAGIFRVRQGDRADEEEADDHGDRRPNSKDEQKLGRVTGEYDMCYCGEQERRQAEPGDDETDNGRALERSVRERKGD